MAPPGQLELRDRMYPSSALQDCAWLLCRVNQSQSPLWGFKQLFRLRSVSSALFIFHSFEKHLPGTFYVPSSGLGAESTPGTLLHAPKSTQDLALTNVFPAAWSSAWSPRAARPKCLFWSFLLCSEEVSMIELSNPLHLAIP